MLELQGLVRVQYGYGGGAFVAEPGFLPVLGALQTSFQLSQVTVRELYQSRVVLEPTIVRLAMAREDPELAGLLSDNLARTEAALAGGEKAFGLNLEFHSVLARAAGNRVVSLLMLALLELLDRLDRDFPTNPAISAASLHDHQEIHAAVSRGDVQQVESLMIQHLTRIEGRFLEMESRLAARSSATQATAVR